jgi:hypothetical protein
MTVPAPAIAMTEPVNRVLSHFVLADGREALVELGLSVTPFVPRV